MRRKGLLGIVALSIAAMAGGIGWLGYQAHEADGLVEEARARLFAPISAAPELHRLQAASAESRLERAIALGRDDDEVKGLARHATALVHFQRGDMVFAESQLGTARDLLGWNADLRVLAAAIARVKTDQDVALEHVEAALELDPDHARALLLRADIALDVGEPEFAAVALERLVAQAPDASVVHNRLGLAEEQLGDLRASEASFREAVRLNRRNHNAWINLGRRLHARGEWRAGAEAFEAAIDQNPGDADAYLGRGLARVQLGARDDAQADFERAAQLAPNDAEPILALGDLARDRRDVEGAVGLYRRALAREDADAASWLKLGNVLVASDELDSAATAFREAIRRAPRLAAAHNGLGASLMYLGRSGEAEQALVEAASLDAMDPNPFLNLGLLRERSGDLAGARAAWQAALERDPRSDVAQARLAAI